MAKLVKCKDCGHEVSKSAKACPNCGAKLPGRHPILITLLALIIIGVFGSLIGTISETDTGPVSTVSSAVAQPKLELLEGWKVTRGEYGNVKITGKVRNNSSKEYGYAQISFNLYDRENVRDILPGDRRQIVNGQLVALSTRREEWLPLLPSVGVSWEF